MQCSFIQQYLVLSPEQCHEFIEAFTNDTRQEPGMIGLDYIDPTKKASTDIKAQFLKEEFEQYNNIITKLLQAAVEEYITTYGLQEQPEFTIHDAYNIQHYKDGEGYSQIHCEWMPDERYNLRMLAWMINLNNAQCGTYFQHQDITTPAVQGVCTIWPAYWTHLHRGVTPNIHDKYKATGWVNYMKWDQDT